MIVNYIGITMAAATYAASNQALEGEKISIRRSFAQVWQNRAALTRWWLFSSLVFGVIQIINHLLETFSSLFGPVLEKVFPALVNSILSVTWGVATYFSIPILMQHPDRPVATLKQSAQLFKQTWGERFSMNIGIGLVGLINLGLSLLLTAIITLKLLPLILVGISNSQFQLLFFIIFLSLSSIFATIIYCADSIFKASLFRYAETGDYVGPFNADLIQTAFTPKRNRFQRSASN